MGERVTWLMSVRNCMPFLRETLESVAAQTYTNFEMLAWNDASTDGTLEELQRWIPSRIPGKIFSGRSFRIGRNLAFLAEQAQTELCAHIDGDDINLPNRLELQVAHLHAHPEVVALGSQVTLIDSQGTPTGGAWHCPMSDADARWRTRWQSSLVHSAVLFRKSALMRAGNYADLVSSEDSELWIRLCPLGEIYSLPEVLVFYRRHPGSATGRCTDFFPDQLEVAQRAAAHLFPRMDPEDAVAFWRLTHPQKLGEQTGLVNATDLFQLSRAATLLAREYGKPPDYFKNTPTYVAQCYWLRRSFLRRHGLLKLADAVNGFARRSRAQTARPQPAPSQAAAV